MTNFWAGSRGVYRQFSENNIKSEEVVAIGLSIGSEGTCISWSLKIRKWLISHCKDVGKEKGFAALEEKVRCPYDGRNWTLSSVLERRGYIKR